MLEDCDWSDWPCEDLFCIRTWQQSECLACGKRLDERRVTQEPSDDAATFPGMGSLGGSTPPPRIDSQPGLFSRLFLMSTPRRAFRYPDYPGGGPYVDESLFDYHQRVWAALDPEIRRRSVKYLRSWITVENAEECRAQMQENPGTWMIPHHMFFGMAIRNKLREVVRDDDLPTGNWDDYYVAAFEEAIGGPEL